MTPEATPGPSASAPQPTLERLRARFAAVKEARAAFLAATADPAAWQAVMDSVDAAQDVGFKLQDSEDEALLNEVYETLEAIDVVRGEVVGLEPR